MISNPSRLISSQDDPYDPDRLALRSDLRQALDRRMPVDEVQPRLERWSPGTDDVQAA